MFELTKILSFLFSQFGAFFSTLVTLLIFHKLMSPTIKFSEFIRSEDLKDKQRSRYSVKVSKRGHIDLIDVKISCRLYVKDIFNIGSSMWTTYNIPVTYSESPVLGRDERVIFLSYYKSMLLQPNNATQIKKVMISKFGTDRVDFEKIFMAFPQAYLTIHLMGNDRFTGVLKVYVSHRYGLWALRQGKWKPDSVSLIRSNDLS